MGIILFLVDTSASMNQRTFLGTSYLDVAKGAIDTFMKYRSRDPASRGDRYMLVSFDEPPNAVKSGWKENHATFIHELKNLQATGLSSFGRALRESFQLLNLHRLHNCIDNYGQGRNPFFLEPAVVIALTDSAKLTNETNVEEELILPTEPVAEGSELTNAHYRWDQRLFTVLLRLPGMGGVSSTPSSVEVALSNMSEATGGKCYLATNHKTMVQAMESLCQKLHPGVVINFRKIGSSSPNNSLSVGSKDVSRSNTPVAMEIDGEVQHAQRGTSRDSDKVTPPPAVATDLDPLAWHSTRKMIYVKSSAKNNLPSGFWPIPESFWPTPDIPKLPPRDVHPVVQFSTVDTQPLLVENFPFDKYELEPSPLTQHILAKKNPHVCWQVYIGDSGKEQGITHPFGYLKASSSLAHVTLFVMPFNYSTLLPLINELQRHGMRPSQKWREEFSDYLSTIPSYYTQPLRNSLRLMGAQPSLVPEVFEFQLNFSITNHLHRLKKQAKFESERVVTAITQSRTANDATHKHSNGIVELGEGISIAIGSTQEGPTAQSFRNPFEIARPSLLEQVRLMRVNFLLTTSSTASSVIEEVTRHQVPINQMGNYQEHLKKLNPLREVDSGAVRTQLFGNPFKLEKRGTGPDSDIGLADEHMVETLGSRRSSGRKRSVRSPSPMPSPRSPRSPSSPSSSSSSPLPSSSSSSSHPPPPQSPAPHKPNTIRERTTATSEEIPNTNKQQSPTSRDFKPQKHYEPPGSREGVNNNTNLNSSETVETTGELPQSRKIKPMVASSVKPLVNSTSETSSNSLNNSLPHRKRERTPSPTPSLPSSKKRAKSPSYPLTNSTITTSISTSTNATSNESMGQLSNPRIAQPVGRSFPGNHSVKLPVGRRLVKPEMSSASKVLNEEIQKQQGQENAKLRALIFKEVKKPGKNYSPQTLFHYLEGVKGSVEVRRGFVQDVIREATKFKRKPLIQALEEWADRLPSFKTMTSSTTPTSMSIKQKPRTEKR